MKMLIIVFGLVSTIVLFSCDTSPVKPGQNTTKILSCSAIDKERYVFDSSDEQFRHLLAQIVVRSNKMLQKDNYVLPFGLTLNKSGDVEVIIGLTEESDDIAGHVDMLQQGLKTKVNNNEIVAISISYPDYENNVMINLLENNENYCAKFVIPVNIEGELSLDVNGLQEEDGGIYVFPICQ